MERRKLGKCPLDYQILQMAVCHRYVCDYHSRKPLPEHPVTHPNTDTPERNYSYEK